MIISFADRGTEDIYDGSNSKRARQVCPVELHHRARNRLMMIDAAASLKDLRSPPGNRLEPLKGDRAGQHSIRINDQYRICFTWADGAGAAHVEITDYH